MQVLNNPEKRAVYDESIGPPPTHTKMSREFNLVGDLHGVFSQYFRIFDTNGNAVWIHTSLDRKRKSPDTPDAPDLERELPCTLEELYTGTIKKRRIVNDHIG